MTDNLIGPNPERPKYPTPWRVGYGVHDATGRLVFHVAAQDLSQKDAVAEAVTEAVNAYYGADPMGAMGELERTEKDARIAELSTALKQANERAEKAEARVRELKGAAEGYRDAMNGAQESAKLYRERAEAAEADRDWYRSVAAHNADAVKKAEDAKEDAEKRAEAAINEMHGTERFAAAMRERAEKAEAELEVIGDVLADDIRRDGGIPIRGTKTPMSEQIKRRLEANRGPVVPLTPYPDTFTAPDGRVFRVGQRVWHTGFGEYGWVADTQHCRECVYVKGDDSISDKYLLKNLRRVWDGTEEPNVSVGTVLRDAEGDTWKKTAKKQWTWVDVPGDFPAPWGQGMLKYGPYVEVLDGDE